MQSAVRTKGSYNPSLFLFPLPVPSLSRYTTNMPQSVMSMPSNVIWRCNQESQCALHWHFDH